MNIITTHATIKHLNIRKEGPDDDKVLAIDIKFGDAAAPMELLARILGTDDTSVVMLSFWDPDGNLRYAGMEPVTSWCVIEGCTVKIGGLVLGGAKVHKFKARLDSEHMITVEFSVSVTSPPSNAVPVLAEYVQDDIRVEVTKAQEELDLGAPEAEPAAEPEADQPEDALDDLHGVARNVLMWEQKASIAFLQRELRIGYNRAARLLDALEAEGAVSPPDSSGKRTVLLERPAA